MQSILYLSVGLIAIAFSILVIYIIRTLKTLQTTMDSVTKTITSLEQQLDGVTKETTTLLQTTNSLADDIEEKTANLNSVVESVKDVGGTVQNFNESLQGVSRSITKKVEENEDKLAQIAQVGMIFFEFRDRWKIRKQNKASSQQSNDIIQDEH